MAPPFGSGGCWGASRRLYRAHHNLCVTYSQASSPPLGVLCSATTLASPVVLIINMPAYRTHAWSCIIIIIIRSCIISIVILHHVHFVAAFGSMSVSASSPKEWTKVLAWQKRMPGFMDIVTVTGNLPTRKHVVKYVDKSWSMVVVSVYHLEFPKLQLQCFWKDKAVFGQCFTYIMSNSYHYTRVVCNTLFICFCELFQLLLPLDRCPRISSEGMQRVTLWEDEVMGIGQFKRNVTR